MYSHCEAREFHVQLILVVLEALKDLKSEFSTVKGRHMMSEDDKMIKLKKTVLQQALFFTTFQTFKF